MSNKKPVFFDESGKRQKIVDFVLIILIFIISIGGAFTVYFIRQITSIENSVKHAQNTPPASSATVLYTENNPDTYTVLGDQIQKINTLIIPRYLVANHRVTTPLGYERFLSSIKAQSINIKTSYSTYYLLSGQDFTKQPVERDQIQSIDSQLTKIIQETEINEITVSIDNANASGLYIHLDISQINTPEQIQQYSDLLAKFKTSLNSHDLHLGIIVDPAEINDINLALLSKSELIYLGQSKHPADQQILGIKKVQSLGNKNLSFEIPTVSNKIDSRETSQSTINIDYRSIAPLMLERPTNRSASVITIGDGTYTYQINDAVSAYNYINAVNQIYNNQNSKFAIADPGFEEYTLWKMVNSNQKDNELADIVAKESASELSILENGNGQIYSVESKATPGQRKLKFDDNNNIVSSTLQKLDTANKVEHFGQKSKKIALTFDDGPNPEYTPKVMKILESHGVRGTFFVTGQNVLAHPETARMLVKNGHEIENHSYSHPVYSMLTTEANKSQIESTNKIIKEVTGVQPSYFRKPYSDRNKATNTSDVAYLELLKELDLKASEYDADSKDWLLDSSEKIISHVKSQINKDSGDKSQLLLHDSHQNTDLTLQALPLIIDYLKSQGYEIVTVNHLADNFSNQTLLAPTNSYRALTIQRAIVTLATWLSIIFIILSFVRYAWMLVGSIFYVIKRSMLKFLSNNLNLHYGTLPKLAVIIACYNEEQVIGKTIDALQSGTFKNFRLILVNDGSTDKTAKIIAEYAKNDKRITLLNVPNGGKSKALEHGMAATKNKWLVFCDADTVFSPNALYEFAYSATVDCRLDAIAGKIIVGNDNNLLTRSQLIEYDVASKFIKSAQDITNMITVVPGASGLWKHKMLEKSGGFLTDTLAEDADATMRVISNGGRVGYRSNIKAYTEAPEKLDMLFKQRTRWQLGNMQSIFKHKKGLFNHRYGTLGYVGLPLFYLELVAAITFPFIFIFTLIMLLNHGLNSIQRLHQVISNPATDYAVFLGLILVTIELFLALFIITTTNKSWSSKFKLLLTLPYFVTVYKVYLSFFTSVALLRALKGKMHGWGHLQRTASVKTTS